MLRVSLTALALLTALPAAAQDRGGMAMNTSLSELDRIQANQGCRMAVTSVTVGINKAMATGASAQQQLGTTNGGGSSGCRPLVSTQIAVGANLALGRGSSAGQSITAQGPGGILATNTYTRGYNMGYGAMASANQRIVNLTGR
jgi:hypothetical protein